MTNYSPVPPELLADSSKLFGENSAGATIRGGPARYFGGRGVRQKNMYYVYVLKSLKNNKKYIGSTSKSPKERLKEHNNGSDN